MALAQIRNKTFAIAATVILASSAAVATARAQQARRGPGRSSTPAAMKGKTAADVYKNIKVLKSVPAGQLPDGMRYITIALGVRCEFCHNTKDFSSDQKRTKKRARGMMSMLFRVNKESFRNHSVVSCYTCHRGHQGPVFAPMPAVEVAQPAAEPVPAMTLVQAKRIKLAPGTKLPTVEQVLAKYAQALGGKAALAQVHTRQVVVLRSGENAKAPPAQEQIDEGAPNKFLTLRHVRNFTVRSGYDGKQGWVATPRGARPLDPMDALVPTRDAQIDPAAALAGYQAKSLKSMAQIGNRKAYVVSGTAPDGEVERLYFDTQSGLLLRRVFIYRTIFGPLLYQADYSEYRKTGGVEMPFRTEWWAGGNGFTETVQSVKTNASIASSEFMPPPKKAGAARRGGRQ